MGRMEKCAFLLAEVDQLAGTDPIHHMTDSNGQRLVQDDLWAVLHAQLAKRCAARGAVLAPALVQQAAARTLLQPGALCVQSLESALQQCGQASMAMGLRACSLTELWSRTAKVKPVPSE